MRRAIPAVAAGAILSSVLLAACSQVASTNEPAVGTNASIVSAGDARRTLWDEDWLFARGDTPAAQDPAFADQSWQQVELPHDWSIDGPYDAKWSGSEAFLPGGIGWYRKHFTQPALSGQERVCVLFGGVYKYSTVYVNGKEVGGRPYGYSTFQCDITDTLKPGDNVIAVRVDHSQFADSRWYPGSGIYRDVYLVKTGPVHIERDGVFVTTPEVSADQAKVNIQVAVMAEKNAALSDISELRARVFDPSGRHVTDVTTRTSPASAGPEDHSSFVQQVTLARPELWSVDHPSLYTLEVDLLENGKVVDTYTAPFGIRTAKFDPNTGFWLNGQNLKLKGVCLHEDAGSLGAAIPRQVWERRLRILKEAGVNAIRTSHNPPDPKFLDLCDRLGFLVMDEAFDEWSKGKKKWMDRWNGQKFSTDGYHEIFAEWSDRDVEDMVRRDRNHPSIVMWSIGNEIDYPNDPYPLNSQEPVAIAKRLVADVKSVDTTRPVTAACASIATNLYYPELDIVGYNYQESRYAADHAAHPDMVIYGSENKGDLAAWLAVKDNPYISAQFLWTGIDYMGEAGPYPNHINGAGLLDVAGYPKPDYFFRQSLWADKPVVSLVQAPAGGRGRGGAAGAGPAEARVLCYTNADSVEFFDGKQSLGEKPLPASHVIDAPAVEPGHELRAVAKKGGQEVAEATWSPPGKAERIDLHEYRTQFGPGAGPNVAQVEVTLADPAGHADPSAAQEISFSLLGKGRILAVDSGDPNSTEDPHARRRAAFHGRLIVYVETHGGVMLTASADGLPTAKLEVGNH
ncbi:MAG TPA: glycoside hydrolase family 2 TIM barrel-domain containing protein [Phycisphaerae bacterium]|nr:glycoside hydrolase family 2 TIM barrel-domain containing protein [Phycisphaerae bacterium]